VSNIFDIANEEWDRGNAKIAFKLFVKAAKMGDKNAFNTLGFFYDKGIAVEKDNKKAYYWYIRGAAKGNSASCLNLGICFRDNGNIRRAKFWFQKAHALGEGSAAYELGRIYAQQRRTRKSRKNALHYLTQAMQSNCIFYDEKKEAEKILKQLQSKV